MSVRSSTHFTGQAEKSGVGFQNISATVFFLFYLMLLVIFLFWPRPELREQIDVVEITDEPAISLFNAIEIHRDRTSSLTFEDVLLQQKRFTPVAGFPTLGFTRDTVWLRIKLNRKEEASAQRVLEFDPNYLDHLTVWQVQKGNIKGPWRIGQRDDRSHSELDKPLMLSVDLPSGRSELYLKIRTGTTMALVGSIWLPDAYARQNEATGFRKGALFGVLMLVFIFNLLFGLFTRNRLLFYFAGYIAFGILSLVDGYGQAGDAFIDGWTQKEWRSLSVFLGATLFFWCLLFSEQFNLRRYHYWLYCCYQVVMLLSVLAIGSAFSGFYHYSYIAPALMVSGVVIAILTSYVAWSWLISGNRYEKVSGLAFICHASFLIPNLLFALGMLESGCAFIVGAAKGTVLYILTIQCAIFFRISQLINEKRDAVLAASHERTCREEQSRFIAMISNEIRIPLAAIEMSASSLKRVAPETEPGLHLGYSRIAIATRKIRTLIDFKLQDCLDSAHWKPAKDHFRLTDLTDSLLEEVTESDKERIGISVRANDCNLIADYSAIKLVCHNLIENALRYSINSETIEVRIYRQDGLLIWEIEDGGPGIADDMIEQAFAKFSRGENLHGHSGTGMGLYTARSMMEQHSGQLTYFTTPNGGGCFRCVFPETLQAHGK